MQRTMAGFVAGAVLAGSVAVVARTSHQAARQTVAVSVRGATVVRDAGHDVSAALATLQPGRARLAAGDPDQSEDREPARGAVGEVPDRGGITEAQREKLRRPLPRGVPHVPDGARQPATPQLRLAAGPRMPTPSISFDGIDQSTSSCGCIPPDTNLAVGPNDVVEVVNTAIAVYDKTTGAAKMLPKSLNALWANFNAGTACRDRNDGDPVVLYDRIHDRWIVSQFAIPAYYGGVGNYECIAVSKTSDPTGLYYRYQFPETTGLLNDYPKLGVWPDGLYGTYNQFDTVTLDYAGPGFVAFDLEAMVAGTAATKQQIDIASNVEGGALPPHLVSAALPSAGAPAPFVEMQSPSTGYPSARYVLRQMQVDWVNAANTTLSGPINLAAAAMDQDMCSWNPSCVPQKGTSQQIDALSDRLMFPAAVNVVNGKAQMLINGTVDVDGNDHAGIRWAQLDAVTSATPVVLQQGTYAPTTTTDRFMGSIAQDGSGDLALGYTLSNGSMFPSIGATGQLVTDPRNQMVQAEAVLFTGTGSQADTQSGTNNRWGDYSAMVIDPADDCTFWFATEYYASTNPLSPRDWRTRIVAFRFPSCGMTPPALPALTISDTRMSEGNSGLKAMPFLVKLSAASATPVSFNFQTANVVASAPSDYVARSSTVTIPVGKTSVTVHVAIRGDTTIERNEGFYASLSTSSGATILDNRAVGTITNDDGPRVTIADATVAEGNAGTRNLTFTLTLLGNATKPVSVSYATADLTATAGSDYIARSGTVTFAPGVQTRTVSVAIKGDTAVEPKEKLLLRLVSATGATVFRTQAVGTIVDDD